MDRRSILENAIDHTCGDRDVEYGSPLRNLGDTARLWNAYLHGRYGAGMTLTPEDVAQFNVMQKISRTFAGQCNADTYEDAAAYSAIAGEVARSTGAAPEDFMAPKRASTQEPEE